MDIDKQQLADLQPYIRIGHHYQFPCERSVHESGRRGYSYAFHLVDAGKGRLTVGEASYPLKKGDLLCLPPQQIHSFYSDRANRLSTYNLYCELWRTEPMDSEHHLYWNEEDYNPGLLTAIRKDAWPSRLPTYMPMQHHARLTEQFAHIVHLHRKQQPLADSAAHSLLKAFLLELALLTAEPGPSDYRMAAIMDRIDREAHAGSDYAGWLAESGLQKTQFHSLFNRCAGMPPKAYWTRAVMRQASAALWESNRSITSIADDLGYPSIHQFTKRFTAYYGVSPTQYRKRKQ